MKKSFVVLSFFLSFLHSNAQIDNVAIAQQLVEKNAKSIGLFGQDVNNAIISDSYFDKTSGLRMVYLQQSYVGLPIYNQLQVLAFKNDILVSKTGVRLTGVEKLVKGSNAIPTITAETAVITALRDRNISFHTKPLVIGSEKNGHLIVFDNMGIAHQNITAELMWVPVEEGRKVVLAWQIYVLPLSTSDYWMVRVNAKDNSIVNVNNLTVYCNWDNPANKNNSNSKSDVSKKSSSTTKRSIFDFFSPHTQANSQLSPSSFDNATYRVIPYPYESPSHFNNTTQLVTNPWDAASANAASLKWHNTSAAISFNYTRGNNVWAREDRDSNNTGGLPATSNSAVDPLDFNFTPSFTVAPTQTSPVKNQQFNITNLFYWNNIIHDLSYAYGFDEPAGNFQANNQGRGGSQNDYVIADAQDGQGTNNANFSTPADGSTGRMQMYLWSGSPQKDGDVDNGVISHEFAHGISNRLTGGPSQAGCLSNAEQMGEGWSDYYGLMYTQNWATATLTSGYDAPRPVGTYVIGQTPTGAGIRSKKYCTNFTINNKAYAASIPAESHDRGEIWCATLWDMTWNIINQVGTINPNLYDADGGGGNTIALKLVTMGMKLQPCSPGFIDGRDAILQADQLLYNGAFSCAIKEAFRRRGMGPYASQGSSESVTDQVADYSSGKATVLLTESVNQIPEGQEITFTNIVSADLCGDIVNFTLRDTLPTNVTYVSGGNYTASTRVVSFPVNILPGQTQQYSFTVRVNAGSYFPTVTLLEDSVENQSLPGTFTPTSTTANVWSLSSARSYSPITSYFSSNTDVQSDQSLTLTNSIALGATPPPLTFRHFYNSEYQYDGGVLEISTNGGSTWTNMQNYIVSGGYSGTMDASTLLANKRAWTGNSGKFVKTKVNLTSFANQNIKIRFRYTCDVGTNIEGWYIDDIAIKSQPLVEMQSVLFNSSNVKVVYADTFAYITPASSCVNASIVSQPSNVTVCEGSSTSFSVTAAGDNRHYQWQVSTDGVNYTNLVNDTLNSLTISNVSSSMNNNLYRVVVSNNCPSSVTSSSASLTVNQISLITSQPVSQNVCIGNTATFSVTASGTNTYQWQVSTNNGVSFTNITTPSAVTNSLVISNVSNTINNSQYKVIITTTCSGILSSNIVNLNVFGPTNNSYVQNACESYTWHGVTYTTNGNYTYSYFNNNGCASVDTLHLFINKTSSISNISVCPNQLPYTWNGITFTGAGTQTAHLTNSLGCDSAATANLTVSNIVTSTTNISICPSALPYTWNGNSYSTSGTYTYQTINGAGCDSVATLNLNIKQNSVSNSSISLCPSNLPYTWNGLIFTGAGTQTAHLTNAAGCDSAATLNLTVKANSSSTQTISVCPSELPYRWNGLIFNSAGTQTAHFSNAAGCDSAATLNLTVKANSSSTQTISVCPSELPYRWNGLVFNSAGTQTAHLSNAVGCDSAATLALTVKLNSSSTQMISICASQLPYSWNGLTFTNAGTQTAHLTNAAGCDSAATLQVLLNDNASNSQLTICRGQLPFIWNGLTFTNAGIQTAHLTNINGCDSAATLQLIVAAVLTSTTNISICPSALPYTWNGNSYSTSGTYTYATVNTAGCDSVATLNLNIKQNSSSNTIISVCPSELPYTWNGLIFTGAGTQTAHLTNAAGCDSAATLNLTVKSNSSSTQIISVCPSELPYRWNGLIFNSAGTQTAHLTNAAGCDSAATLNLTVKVNTSSTQTISVCPSELPYNWNGLIFTSAGTQTAHLSNEAHCDSAATLTLTVKVNSSSTQMISICASQLPYSWNGLTFNNAGTQTAHLTNAVGCDSAATLQVLLNDNASNSQLAICRVQLPIIWNGLTFNNAGTQTAHLTNINGCDSAATLTLLINDNSSDTTFSILNSQLPYRWNGLIFYSAGTQTAHLTNIHGCDSSATLNLKVIAPNIVYPNPTPNGQFKVNLSSLGYSESTDFVSKNIQMCVFDLMGRIILKQKITSLETNVNLENCSNSFYFISIQSADGSIKIVKKLIKGFEVKKP